jgi:hypothetical protein
MIRRIDQQIAVNRLMMERVDFSAVADNQLLVYMMHYLEIVTCVSMVFLMRSKTKENLAKKGALWECAQETPVVREYFRRSILIFCLCRMGAAGRCISMAAYQFARLLYGFN